MNHSAGAWIAAITIGEAGLPRPERTPEEQRAWVARVQAVAARARAAMLQHGATEASLDPEQCDPLPGFVPLRHAARSFFETLTPEQRAAMAPASRGGYATIGTVLDLLEGLQPTERGVRMRDEFVAVAEAVWPEVER